MKRYLRLSVISLLAFLAIISQTSIAQVYSLYEPVTIVQGSYTPLEIYTELNPGDFALPPNFSPTDRDDGYHRFPVQLPFPFDYNGIEYTQLWVNVNGFVCFTQPGRFPPNVKPNVNDGLFIKSSSFPDNVIAPFWGDHYYRSTSEDIVNNYIRSSIRVGWEVYDAPYRVFIIEWVDLNIMNKALQSSVATFQLRLYESQVDFSKQGNIEFAYSRTGSPRLHPSVGTTVVIRGAVVGIKGEASGITGDDADYVNGLWFDGDIDSMRISRLKTDQWPPSDGATDKRIRFTAIIRKGDTLWWGDGDANLSKAPGNKHFRMPQNRFVTVEDARVIMRSIVTSVPLDSVRGREAFHGDVNHNGRFYYNRFAKKTFIPWRSKNYWDDVPDDVYRPEIQILYQVTEYDASMILHYLAARLPSLPWILDTVPKKGKFGVDDVLAENIKTGEIKSMGDNTYLIPIYINGYLNGPIGFKFDVNGEIIDLSNASNLQLMSNLGTLVVAGSGEFDNQSPVCYATIQTDSDELIINNIRFNDIENAPIKLKLNKLSENQGNEILKQNSPNPFSTYTNFAVTIPTEGYYSIEVYDVYGNKVQTIHNGHLSSQPYSFSWDGTDFAGSKVAKGIYVLKLSGDNISLTKKMIYN